jgi:lysophospholipase L1-like esterase
MMELSLQQIQWITHGAVRVERENDTVRFFRFTEEQEALYRNYTAAPSFYNRTFATAGITLEFDTDSESLHLAVQVRAGCGFRWFTHSIFADDRRIGEISGFVPENAPFALAQGTFSLGAGMKRIRIHFPWNEISALRSLTLDDGAKVIPVPKKRRTLIFGDSITQGYITWLPENSYVSRIARGMDADMINKGIGGEAFRPPLADLPEPFQPDLILTAYGVNDWSSKTEEKFVDDALAFFSNLRKNYPDARIVALTPIWHKAIPEKEKTRWPFQKITDHLKAAAKAVGRMTVLDGMELVPHDTACFAEDQIHPNDIGFGYYAQALQRRLAEILY